MPGPALPAVADAGPGPGPGAGGDSRLQVVLPSWEGCCLPGNPDGRMRGEGSLGNTFVYSTASVQSSQIERRRQQ